MTVMSVLKDSYVVQTVFPHIFLMRQQVTIHNNGTDMDRLVNYFELVFKYI